MGKLSRDMGKENAWQVRLPQSLMEESLANIPAQGILMVRNPENLLVLNACVPDNRLENDTIEKIFIHILGLLPVETFVLEHQSIEDGD